MQRSSLLVGTRSASRLASRRLHAPFGFTLVELLVVLAILGVLAGLVIPAVQWSREAARKLDCQSRLKQIAVAANMHLEAKGRYPGFQELLRGKRAVNWQVTLLPFLGDQPVYDGLADLPLGPVPRENTPYRRFYYCTSVGSPDKQFPQNSYVANAGFGPRAQNLNAPQSDPGSLAAGASKGLPVTGAFNDYWDFRISANGPFVDRVAPPGIPTHQLNVDDGDLRDGKSNTILLSENVRAGHWSATSTVADPMSGTLAAPQPNTESGAARRLPLMFWIYAHNPNVAIQPAPPLTPPPPPQHARINGGRRANPAELDIEWYRPSSEHSRGVNMARADGSVFFASESMDYHVYIQRMTCDAEKSLMPFPGYVLQDDE